MKMPKRKLSSKAVKDTPPAKVYRSRGQTPVKSKKEAPHSVSSRKRSRTKSKKNEQSELPPKNIVVASNQDDCLMDSDKIYLSFLQSLFNNDISYEPLKDVCDLLKNHYYKLLGNIIQYALKYKRHCRRTVLNTSDFNKGLIFCNQKPIISFIVSDKTNSKINLSSTLNLEPEIKFPLDPIKVEAYFANSANIVKPVSEISDNLKSFFRCVVQTIKHDSERDENSLIVMNSLKENYKISFLIPYFLNFFSSELNSEKDLSKSKKLFEAIACFYSNRYLYFGNTLHTLHMLLINSLLKCLLDTSYVHSDPWLSRDSIAELLGRIVRKIDSEIIFTDIFLKLCRILEDFKLPMVTHYGSLVTANSLGLSALSKIIAFYIEPFFQHFVSPISGRKDFIMVHTILKQFCSFLVKHYCKYKKNYDKYALNDIKWHLSFPGMESKFENISDVSTCVLRCNFNKYFGDSLTPAFFCSSCSVLSYKNLHIL